MQPKEYIEEWYQKVVMPQYSSILREILAANRRVKSISHILTKRFLLGKINVACLEITNIISCGGYIHILIFPYSYHIQKPTYFEKILTITLLL